MNNSLSLKGLIKLIAICVLIVIIASCNNKAVKPEQSNIQPVAKKDSVKNVNMLPDEKNRNFNDAARYISGLKQLDGTAIDTSYTSFTWQKYADEQNGKWARLDNDHFAKMHAFSKAELSNVNNNKPTLFYPFSGPDFLNATTFFPEAKDYIMLALEPPGSLPNITKFPKDSLKGYFNSIDKSLESIINFSFFRTLSMAVDFHTKELNGAVQLLSIFMERTGHTILNMEPITIDTSGKYVPENKNTFKCPIHGMHITCVRNDNGEVKNVYYLSVNIKDDGLAKNRCMTNFLKNLPTVVTYVKSASYLMHKTAFSIIRSTILEKSKYILQDDSGIPIKYFMNSGWTNQLYGVYDRPIDLFKNCYQKDLRALYDSTEKKNIKPLSFGIGYDYKVNESNLMLFTKK